MELKIPPPVVILITAVSMWLISQLSFGQLHSEVLSFLSVPLFCFGFFIDLAAILTFRLARTTINPLKPGKASHLVTMGVYRYSRNPMYLGALLILTGWCFLLGNLINLIFLPLFVWYITRYQIIPEEQILMDRFPTEYRTYQESTRRWAGF